MKSKSAFLVIILCSLRLFCWQDGKQVRTDSSPRYLVLDTVRVKTLNQELEWAAAVGYRVAWDEMRRTIFLILEKVSGKYQYRVLHSFTNEFTAAAADAFCAIPTTFSSEIYKAGTIIMEKPEDSSKVHDYLLTRDRPDQDMEKRSPNAPSAPDRYLLLATTRTSTMQTELNDAVSKGYAVAAGSGGDELILIMEKATNAPEYLLLARSRSTSLEKEINRAACARLPPPSPDPTRNYAAE